MFQVSLLCCLILIPFVYSRHEIDPCMERLHFELFPSCGENLCSPECCDALVYPEHNECSSTWILAYIQYTQEIKSKQATQNCICENVGQPPCQWSTQYLDSPCHKPDCASLFNQGMLTPECHAYIDTYCAYNRTLEHDACSLFNTHVSMCGSQGASWGSCTVLHEEHTIINQCVANYTSVNQTSGPHRAIITPECKIWIDNYGCATTNDTHSLETPVQCNCAVLNRHKNEASGNTYFEVLPCAFEVVRLTWLDGDKPGTWVTFGITLLVVVSISLETMYSRGVTKKKTKKRSTITP